MVRKESVLSELRKCFRLMKLCQKITGGSRLFCFLYKSIFISLAERIQGKERGEEEGESNLRDMIYLPQIHADLHLTKVLPY